MAKKIVTLYIEDSAINVLVMNGEAVDKWLNVPLEPGLVTQGLVNDEAKVASQLSELFKREKVKTRKIVLGLNGLNSVYRIVTLPELPAAIMPEAVKHEAERIIPVPMEQVYLSYQALPTPKGESRVFLAAFPRNTTDSLMRTLQKAGLRSRFMELAPLALARIPNEPRAIVVDARSDNLNIMVISDRLPEVIRGLSLPGENMSTVDKLPAISEELSRTVTFYNSTHVEKPLDPQVPVFVCGDLVDSPESYQALVGSFRYPVAPLPSPISAPEGFNNNTFMINIGLALREMPQAKTRTNASIINFNAMPEVYLPKAFPIQKVLVPVGVAIGLGVVAFVGLQVQAAIAHTNELNLQLTSVQASVNQQNKEITLLTDQIKQDESQVDPIEKSAAVLDATLADLRNTRERSQGDVDQIVSAGLSQTYLVGVNHLGGTVTVNGKAYTRDEVFKYAAELRASGRFTSVAVTSITQDTAEDVLQPFDYRLTLVN